MPENYENDANYIGKGEMRVTPNEVELMASSIQAALGMTDAGLEAANEHGDKTAAMAYMALQFGLLRCKAYFKEMQKQIEKAIEERKKSEPDLNELNDSDRS